MQAKKVIRIGSLFSGIGGIELGLEKAGEFETEWFVENDLYAQAVLRKHWKNKPIYGDIKKINFKELPEVNMLTGGFPCQDISNAGKRKGITGERSGLWKEFFRAISEIRPRLVFVENVSALTFRGLLVVLGDLASLRYDAEWHCLPASAIGAPHRRDRVYILAYANSGLGIGNSNRAWFEKSSYGKNDVANSISNGIDEGNRQNVNRGKESQEHSNQFICSSANVSDSNSKGLERRGELGIRFEEKRESMLQSEAFSFSYDFNYWRQRKKRFFEKNRKTTWATDAGILRVANGIPFRIHRIKCLGNAVVPACAEFFAERIKEIAKERGN